MKTLLLAAALGAGMVLAGGSNSPDGEVINFADKGGSNSPDGEVINFV